MNIFAKTVKRLQWALTSKKKQQKLMDDVIGVLAFDKEASTLLDMARADNVKIGFAMRLRSKAAGRYDLKKRRIELEPFDQSGKPVTAEVLATYLVHELRHCWQYKKLGVNLKELKELYKKPRLMLVFNRITEADAFAFQGRFVKSVNETIKIVEEKTSRGVKTSLEDALSEPADGQYIGEMFQKMLKDKSFSAYYDTTAILNSCKTGMKAHAKRMWGKKGVSPSEEATDHSISSLRSILKAGLTDEAPRYLDNLSDRQLEALVLRHAHKGARKTAQLLEKFNAASASNDNETVESVFPRIKKETFKLLKIKRGGGRP